MQSRQDAAASCGNAIGWKRPRTSNGPPYPLMEGPVDVRLVVGNVLMWDATAVGVAIAAEEVVIRNDGSS